MKSHVIGLTGQSGAGKTTVSRVFAEKGFSVIDADLVAREVMKKGSPCLDEVAEHFGRTVLRPDGELDRKKLGTIVFSDKDRLRELDALCYPYIIKRIREKINELSEKGSELILLDAPTLFEAGADELCDLVISVTADEETREKRIVARDGITPEEAKKRFASQYSQHFFETHSDYVIRNNKTHTLLCEKAREAADKIKEYCNARNSKETSQA